MSRKKHAEHVNHERWLVSYADFITLLFAFFVVLFASSQSDKKKSAALAGAMQAAFAQYGIFEPHARTPPLLSNAGAAETTSMLTPVLPPAQRLADRRLESEMRRLAEASGLGKQVSIRRGPDGLVLSLQEAGFFGSGSAEVSPAALSLLLHLASRLPDRPIRVEGHTDDVPIHNQQFRSNWELSTARANEIARVLMEQGGPSPSSFTIAGYGQFHPITANATEEGRAKNRRVDIVLLTSSTSTRPAP